MPGKLLATIEGDEALVAALNEISEEAVDKIAPAGMRGYLRVMTKGIKAEIPGHLKDARRGIGSRFVKKDKRTGKVVAKAGVAVAQKRSKRDQERAKVKAKRPRGRGVGISAANLHWAIKGTGPRETKSGRPTGTMRPIAPGIVPRAYRKSRGQALAKFRELTKAAMVREAAKIRKKSRRKLVKRLTGI